ncbi:MAG: hypothetical protein HQM12_03165 [SAR324 cluster bacterium]|nr:hypothetical protein [SAR324 cluster bacterium]
MPNVIGLGKSTFNKEKYRETFAKNSGEDSLTTEDFLKGFDKAKQLFDEDCINELKKSPMFISKV